MPVSLSNIVTWRSKRTRSTLSLSQEISGNGAPDTIAVNVQESPSRTTHGWIGLVNRGGCPLVLLTTFLITVTSLSVTVLCSSTSRVSLTMSSCWILETSRTSFGGSAFAAGFHGQSKFCDGLTSLILCDATETTLVVWQTIDDDQVYPSSVMIVRYHEIFTFVDAFVVMEPRNFGHRLTGHNTRHGHFPSVRRRNILEILGECRRNCFRFRRWIHQTKTTDQDREY